MPWRLLREILKPLHVRFIYKAFLTFRSSVVVLRCDCELANLDQLLNLNMNAVDSLTNQVQLIQTYETYWIFCCVLLIEQRFAAQSVEDE